MIGPSLSFILANFFLVRCHNLHSEKLQNIMDKGYNNVTGFLLVLSSFLPHESDAAVYVVLYVFQEFIIETAKIFIECFVSC